MMTQSGSTIKESDLFCELETPLLLTRFFLSKSRLARSRFSKENNHMLSRMTFVRSIYEYTHTHTHTPMGVYKYI